MLKQRLKNTFIRPRQLILLDTHGSKPSRSINIRLITLIGVLVTLLVATMIAGMMISTGEHTGIVPRHLQLQREYEQLQADLAESLALYELQSKEMDVVKSEMLKVQASKDELQQRVKRYESILEARKAAGVQLINSDVSWSADGSLQYDFTLVKGGSYPRFVAGSLVITVQSPEGESIELPLGKESSRLPFRVETHTFLRGYAEWNQEWRPEKLNVSAFDQRGKELFQTEISVDGAMK